MSLNITKKSLNSFVSFVCAREQVRINKETGKKWPWTNDPILREYRFCNIRREHDAVTRWIAKNWREPHAMEDHLWFAMVVARLVNLPGSLEDIGYPVPWRPSKFVQRLNARKASGANVFNAAYIVSTNGNPMDKVEYLVEHVLDPLWEDRGEYAPRGDDTLSSFYKRLRGANGLGNFMAAQVVADMKYDPNFGHASDWDTFAASGPGSKRGMNRVLKLPLRAPLLESVWHEKVLFLREEVNAALRGHFPGVFSMEGELHAQDIQNCLCEYDKYERAHHGEGRPKSKYRPS